MKKIAFLTLLCLLASKAILGQGPPPGGPPAGPDQRPVPDQMFLYVQMMRAIEGKADLLIEQGKGDAGVDELRRVFSLDVPKESPPYEIKVHLIGKLAITLTNLDRRKEAVETIQKLLNEVPQGTPAEATAWLNAGTVYRQSGMPDDALKAFDRAIELSQKLVRSPGAGGRPPGPRAGGRPPQQPPHPNPPPSQKKGDKP